MNGLSVFMINTEGQAAASDVNHDGRSLSVADFVYLTRIILGNALPYNKLKLDTAQITHTNGILSIDKEIGAALVVLEGNEIATLLVDNMTMMSNFDGTNTNVFVYSLEGNSFSGDFLDVSGNVVSVEFGSPEGSTVALRHAKLGANYPNPFSEITVIPFYLMTQAEVTIIITTKYGKTVYTHTNRYPAGDNEFMYDGSTELLGDYRYTIIVNGFEETRTMTIYR